MADNEQDIFRELRAMLADPASYPEAPRKVEVIETHISCVFLTEMVVYKLKKPVRFEFVDFSTAEARRHACEEEVRLNRRLARDTYLGVVPIMRDATGRLALGGDGEAVDWVVAMRRLPAERMLDMRMRDGSVTESDVTDLAQVLGDFYAAAPAMAVDPEDYREELEAHVRANCADLSAATKNDELTRVRRSHAAQLQFLALHAPALNARVRSGRVIDGHGDLRPEHVCLTEPPVVFDCLEFDARLRRLDVADELSFFVMECDRLGAGRIGRQVRAACLVRCGDAPPAQLLHFYQAYRACVRAKVAALRAKQLSGDARTEARREMADYLRLADEYGRDFSRPLLVVVSGLMGSGKSTLARALAERLGCVILQTDALRRELLGPRTANDAVIEGFDEGRYAPAHRQRVYEEMLSRAAARLADRESVILDGTFLAAELLRRAAAMGNDARAAVLVVRCHCPDEVARTRVAARLAAGGDLSEARPELFDRQRLALEAVADGIANVEVDTTRSLAEQVAAVIERLRSLVAA